MSETDYGRVREQVAADSGFMNPSGLPATLANGMGGVWPKMKMVKFLDCKEKDTQAFVASSEDGQHLLLSIRGTTSGTDWSNNLLALRTRYEPLVDGDDAGKMCACKLGCRAPPNQGMVHRGFYEAFLPMRDLIDEHLMPKLNSKDVKELSIVGHSLGGAVATLSLAYVLMRGPNLHGSDIKVTCFTIGSPRVGDADFRTFLRKSGAELRKKKLLRHYRVHLDADVVPSVPPRFLGYVHTGRVVRVAQDSAGQVEALYFKHDGTDDNEVGASEDVGLDGKWKPPHWSSAPLDRVADHMPGAYYGAFKHAGNIAGIEVALGG